MSRSRPGPYGKPSQTNPVAETYTSSGGRLTSSGWSIRYGDALSAWLFTRCTDDWEFDVVEAWIQRRQKEGPPADGQRVWEDLFQAMIRPTAVIATYLVNEDERLVVVKEFW